MFELGNYKEVVHFS